MKFKVCCCWDDGVVNDIRLVEMLRKHGAKATFNLNPGLMPPEIRGVPSWVPPGPGSWSFRGFSNGKLSLRDIPEIYDGFELASHCWKHESAGTMPDSDWIRTAMDARKFIEDIVQRPCRGFAYPNGRFTPGAMAELRKAGFAYGRTTKNVDDFLSENSDPMALAANCHYLNNNKFWKDYEAARSRGRVFYFWGHSYEMMEYDRLWQFMDDTFRHIAEDPDAEWITVEEAASMLPHPVAPANQ